MGQSAIILLSIINPSLDNHRNDIGEAEMLMTGAYSSLDALARLVKAASCELLDEVKKSAMLERPIEWYVKNQLEMDTESWECLSFALCWNKKDFEYLGYNLKITREYFDSINIDPEAKAVFMDTVHRKQVRIFDIIAQRNASTFEKNCAVMSDPL